MTSKQLKSLITPYRIICKVLNGIFAIIIISTIIYLIIAPDNLIAFIILLGCVTVFACLHDAVHNKIKRILVDNDNFIGVALKEAFGDSVEYCQDGEVAPGPMEFPFSYNKVYGEGHIKAVYKGLNIELSDMTLKNEEMNAEGDINAFTVFRGQLFVCDLRKELSGEVFISANSGMDKPGFERDVMMDNKEFDDRFRVKTKVPEEAFCILTPHMMGYILKMADKVNGRVYMAFLRSGKIYIAVNTNRNILKLGDTTKADYDTLMQKYLGELKWFTDMIDTLRLNDKLYKKEANV